MVGELNSVIAVIGIDIGKNSFHLVGLDERGAMVVATENLIRHELTSEVPNRVIIPPHAGDGRTAAALTGVAGEVATSARS
jgi:hypothetical protein